jgi:hypothetical protein
VPQLQGHRQRWTWTWKPACTQHSHFALLLLLLPVAGHPLSKALQNLLVTPLMAAAAAAAGAGADTNSTLSAAYSNACVRLLHAVCSSGSANSQPLTATLGFSASQQHDSSKVSESLALACRLQPHLILACQQSGG